MIRTEAARESVRHPGRGPVSPARFSGEKEGPSPVGFVAGEIQGALFRPLKAHRDARGWLVELFRHDEMSEGLWPVMAYASMTLPGVTRGPHEHADQTDGFAFIGPSDFRVWLWDTRPESPTFGHTATWDVGESNPAALWVPPGVVHAYRNTGDVPGLVFNAPNRLYAGWGKRDAVDEVRHEDAEDDRFPMA